MKLKFIIIAALFFCCTSLFAACSPGVSFERGEEALRLKQYEEAIKQYKKVVKSNKEDPQILKKAYSFFDDLDTVQFAYKSYDRLAEIYNFHYLRFDEGIKFLLMAIELCPNVKTTLALRRKLADVYFENLKDYQLAIIEYQRLIANSPTYAKENDLFLYRIISSYLSISNYQQVQNESRDFFKKYPKSPYRYDVQFAVAQSLELEGNKQKAIKHYKKMLKRLKGKEKHVNLYAETAFLLGNIYNSMDMCDMAEAKYQLAARYHPHPETVIEKRKGLKKKCKNLKPNPERLLNYQHLMQYRTRAEQNEKNRRKQRKH